MRAIVIFLGIMRVIRNVNTRIKYNRENKMLFCIECALAPRYNRLITYN